MAKVSYSYRLFLTQPLRTALKVEGQVYSSLSTLLLGKNALILAEHCFGENNILCWFKQLYFFY